jgi:DMSO reductase anchor subunit
MGKRQRKQKLSRQEMQQQLDRTLLRIGLFLFIVAGAVEFFSPAEFSLGRFALLCAIGAMGLLVGRTIGRWMFINRQSSEN